MTTMNPSMNLFKMPTASVRAPQAKQAYAVRFGVTQAQVETVEKLKSKLDGQTLELAHLLSKPYIVAEAIAGVKYDPILRAVTEKILVKKLNELTFVAIQPSVENFAKEYARHTAATARQGDARSAIARLTTRLSDPQGADAEVLKAALVKKEKKLKVLEVAKTVYEKSHERLDQIASSILCHNQYQRNELNKVWTALLKTYGEEEEAVPKAIMTAFKKASQRLDNASRTVTKHLDPHALHELGTRLETNKRQY